MRDRRGYGARRESSARGRPQCSLVNQQCSAARRVDCSTLEAQRGGRLLASSSKALCAKRERSAEKALGADRRTLACLRGTLRDACEACPRPSAKGARLSALHCGRYEVARRIWPWVARGRRARPRAGAAPASASGVPPETPSGEAGCIGYITLAIPTRYM